ncbi:MAG: HAD family phosphatase [Paracoccaceae bacterium]
MTFKAALFDMDGLLLDTERVGMDVFRTLMAAYDVTAQASDTLYRNVVGTSFANTRARVIEAVPHVDIDAMDADWAAGVEAAMAKAVPLRPRVLETLSALHEKRVPMAVVTTTRTPRARHHLERAGLLPFFVDVIGFDRVSAPKPDPAPYTMGAQVVGFDPGHCAAFEDSDPGVHSATAAGCTVWQIPDLRPKDRAFPLLGQSIATDLREAVEKAGLL